MLEHNPWWFGESHYVYEKWRRSEIKWIPEEIKEMESPIGSLNFIVGPRQIGKTTLVMIYIHRVLLPKMNPKQVFYYSCDELVDFRELGEILDNYLSYKKENNLKNSYIFLDEITFVEDWWRAIKKRIDSGRLKRDILYLTGSASLELIAGKERFPGRRGGGKDIYLLPMTFNQYEKYIKRRPIREKNFSPGEKESIISSNKVLKDDISADFKEYLETGGFPLSIKEFYQRGVTYEAQKSYLDWLKTDILKINKSEKNVKEILSVILKARATPISWLEISKETGIGSPNTVKSYIDALEKLFLLKTLEFIEPTGKPNSRKNKKIHLTDPFLYKIASRWTRVDIQEETLVESIVAMHLNKIGETYYWRNSTEIDVVLKIEQKLYGYEIKWGPKPRYKKRPIRTITLTKDEIPIYLATIKWPNKTH